MQSTTTRFVRELCGPIAVALVLLSELASSRSAIAADADQRAATAVIASRTAAKTSGLNVYQPAPELDGGTEWFNTAMPIHLKDLRGKFVILDFWTYCCINCMHVLPELKKLEIAYPNNVVVIGVHSGKFDTEHDSESIRQAILRNEIAHLVVNDSEYKIWKSYGCGEWPTLIAVDPQGNLLASHSGEIDFATLNTFLKENLPKYRSRGLLDERPLHFPQEKDTAIDTPLRYPGKILADKTSGRLFISDSGHNRLIVATMQGKALSVIGAGSVGRADGSYAAAQFNHPQGLALHEETLYVADTENHLLRKVDLINQRVSTIAGTGQEALPNTPMKQASEHFWGGPLSTALSSPWAVCVSGGNLYIAMAGAHQIWTMPLNESKIGPFAGNGQEDIVNGPLLPHRVAPVNSSSFAQPSGLACDGKQLYVADSEGSSVRVVPLDPSGRVSTIIGTAGLEKADRLFTFGDVDGSPSEARLQHCMDTAVCEGRLFIADTYNHKIKVIDLKTLRCSTFAGYGKPGTDDVSDGQSAQFFEPAGITYAGGKLFVADTNNHRIRVIDLNRNQISTLQISGL